MKAFMSEPGAQDQRSIPGLTYTWDADHEARTILAESTPAAEHASEVTLAEIVYLVAVQPGNPLAGVAEAIARKLDEGAFDAR